jgi:hypothetical protein
LTADFPALVQYDNRMFMFWKTAVSGEEPMRWSELRGDVWVQPGEGAPYDPSWPISGVYPNDGVAVAEHQDCST